MQEVEPTGLHGPLTTVSSQNGLDLGKMYMVNISEPKKQF